MAQTWDHDFLAHFQEATPLKEIEGVVARRRAGVLNSLCTKYWETTDLVRFRKSTKLYTH